MELSGWRREAFDHRLNRRTRARIVSRYFSQRGFERRNGRRIAVHFETQRRVLRIVLQPAGQSFQHATVADPQRRQNERHVAQRPFRPARRAA